MSTDIREGDLVKATSRHDPETTITGRVSTIGFDGALYFRGKKYGNRGDRWNFEVLDRPLPPISDELLFGAVDTYRKSLMNDPQSTESLHPDTLSEYKRDLAAVINFVRKYDAEHDNKENAK